MSVTYSSFTDSFCEPNWRSYGVIEFDCDGAFAPVVDPDDGSEPVFLGPYFLDQCDSGSFDLQGPSIRLLGPTQRSVGGYWITPWTDMA